MPAEQLLTGVIKNPSPVEGVNHEPISSVQANDGSGWDNFINGLRTYFGFGSGGPASGTGSAGTGLSLPGTGSSPQLPHDVVNDVVENISGVYPDPSGSSAKSSDQIDVSSLLGSSAISSSQGLSLLKSLYEATGDNAYLELIATSILNKENVASARDWEKMMSDTSFSRLVDDIKSAGYNPWLALQNGFGTASSTGSSVASSGSSAISSSRRSSETSKENVEAQLRSSNMRAGLTTAMALILALMRFAI